MPDLNAIVEAHSDAVWRTVYRLLNHREDALECYQETFVAALHLSGRDDVLHWRTMLQRIATRRAIDRLRRRYRDEKTSTRLNQLAYDRPAAEPPDARILADELREQVRWALAILPPRQAEAFWLRHVEQLSPDEVARMLDIEPGHARVLVHRAAEQLRTLLGSTYRPQSVSRETP